MWREMAPGGPHCHVILAKLARLPSTADEYRELSSYLSMKGYTDYGLEPNLKHRTHAILWKE
jgi:hypothetical protein